MFQKPSELNKLVNKSKRKCSFSSCDTHTPYHFLMNITGTCCTRLSWACRGCCPWASGSPWDHFKSIYIWKIVYKHAPCKIFNINSTCSTPYGWACRGRGRPRSPWDPYRSFSFQKSFMKLVSNVNFWSRIAYLSCTWRLTLRAL